jgi:chromosome segregation ATPase
VLTGERVGAVGDEVDQVLAADVSPDHAHVALGGPSKKLKIFSTKDSQLLHTLKKHTDWVTAVAFSPDGRYLASADRNGGIMVWEGASGKEYNPLPGHKLGVTSLSFMPGVLASASTDGKITLWDVKEAKEIRSWTAHNGGVEWIDFTPDGRLVSCGRDRYAKVWDQNGKVLFTSAEFSDIALRSALNTERVIAADWSGKIRAFSLDGKPLAELTANPATIAEQLDFASQRLADAQLILPGLQQAFQSADQKLKAEREAAEVKRTADIAAAEKTQIAAQAAIESAKANLAALEKRLIEEKAAVEQSKAAHDSANTALDAIAKTLTEKKAANAPDLAAAEQELGQKTAARDEIAKKLEERKARPAATETEIAKAKEELPKTIATQEKAIADAKALFVQLTSPPPRPKPVVDEAKVASVAKKLEELNAEIARRREERGRFRQGSAEYEKADMAVQAVKPDIAKAETDLAAAKEPALPVPKISPTEIEFNKAKAAFEEASAAVAAMTTEVQRLHRAQAYMSVYRAERSCADLKAQHEQLVATAKEALKPAEQLREQIAALEKTRVEGPQKIKEAEAVLTSAVQARDAANKAVGDTQAMIAEKEKASTIDRKAIEAEAAAAAKKLEELNAEIARRREARGKTQQGTPEYQRADAEVQGIKPEIANAEQALAAAKAKMDPNQKPPPSPELVAAREALKKAELEAKLATDKVPPAQKALADLQQTLAAGVQKLAELRQTIPAITQQANQTKAKAEQEAAALAKEVDRSKAEATRVRAEFDAKWPRNDQRQAQR